MTSTQIGTEAKKDTKDRIPRPNKWDVVVYDDSKSTWEFVNDLLMTIYKRTKDEAREIIKQIENAGKGVAGTYDREIALTKADEGIKYSRKRNMPLKIQAEKKP